MPIPKRQPSETKDKFIERCMGDPKMVSEFPDNRRRYAVCISQSKK